MRIGVLSSDRIRDVAWVAFFSVIVLAWASMIVMITDASSWLCGPEELALLPYAGYFTLFSMWALMMAAMMLPTIVPTLSSYFRLPKKSGASMSGWIGIVLGYGGVWLIGAAAFSFLQVMAQKYGWLALNGAVSSWWGAAVLFSAAGIWQFTRGKEICQEACLSPMSYFLTKFRPGLVGGWQMGVDIGIVCVGCCWAIMALAFVGGVMSLWWMGIATIFMVLEKLPDIGMRLRKPAGIVLLGAALFSLLKGTGVL